MELELDVKCKEVETISEFIDAIRIRVNVFIKEQGFEPGWEPDEDDKASRHFVAIADGIGNSLKSLIPSRIAFVQSLFRP